MTANTNITLILPANTIPDRYDKHSPTKYKKKYEGHIYPLTAIGELSDKNTGHIIIDMPKPKPVINLPTHRIIGAKAAHSMAGPNSKKASESRMVNFLPILSATDPAMMAPIVPPKTA
jgi:hypothetical protein